MLVPSSENRSPAARRDRRHRSKKSRRVEKESFERGKGVEETGGRAASEIRPGEVGFGLPAAPVETAGVVERKKMKREREDIYEKGVERAGPLISKGGG